METAFYWLNRLISNGIRVQHRLSWRLQEVLRGESAIYTEPDL